MNISELYRRLTNIVRFGIVTESKSNEGKALCRVKVGRRVTDFLPVKGFSNSFKRHFVPVRPGEQVVVFSPFGEASSGFVLRSIFNKGSKEPSGSNEHTEVIEYEDGTRILYDTKNKKLDVSCAGDVSFNVAGNITITAGGAIDIDGSAIYLN